ncbi:MAG: GntR family transcriptional regulator [Cyclobacteriaceae bacterium]|nr:GntR family transcriptional regulator [Cyclobacteriaceae bacterium]
MSKTYKHLALDEYSATPKYIQLANAVIRAVSEGRLKKDEQLPSINELSVEFEISKDTVEKSYKHLKKTGVVGSVPGKGYFISNTDVKRTLKIFLLFNKLSEHKKIIYDAFAQTLGESATIDFYIYNNDFALFKKLLLNCSKNDYSYFVIIPHFLEGGEYADEVIKTIPSSKLLLLDKKVTGLGNGFSEVVENFEQNIYSALEEALEPLRKYKTLKIVFPDYTYHPKEILKGFHRFCHQYAFSSKVVNSIEDEPITAGEVYINLMEKDLVILIEKILSQKLKVGKDVGVISYNEIPLKKIILNGITTISTDFYWMGERAAKIVLENTPQQVEVPFRLTLRASL